VNKWYHTCRKYSCDLPFFPKLSQKYFSISCNDLPLLQFWRERRQTPICSYGKNVLWAIFVWTGNHALFQPIRLHECSANDSVFLPGRRHRNGRAIIISPKHLCRQDGKFLILTRLQGLIHHCRRHWTFHSHTDNLNIMNFT
jgi:hypothetical protein